MAPPPSLRILNARENNLKGIDVEIQHDTFTVITGPSGSGKSSLAFATIYAEGQRRYVETFSPYTRQFFDKVKKPEVDVIEHVRPAIALQQRTKVLNSRSTVGSLTNINDYLKTLWSHLAEPSCPQCGIKLYTWDATSAHALLTQLLMVKEHATFLIAAPVPFEEGPNGALKEFERLETLGFSRFFLESTGELVFGEEVTSQVLAKERRLLVVFQRIRAGSLNEKEVKEALEHSFTLGNGTALLIELPSQDAAPRKPWKRVIQRIEHPNLERKSFELYPLSSSLSCEHGPLKLQKNRPGLFSYNNPLGACPKCKGFGNTLSIDIEKCIPDITKSIAEKCIQIWSSDSTKVEFRELLKFCQEENIPTDVPWKELPQKAQERIIHAKTKQFWGILPWFDWIEQKTYKMHVRVFLARYRTPQECSECRGSRLRQDALAYKIKGKSISDIFSLTVQEAREWLQELCSSPRYALSLQIEELFKGVLSRLEYLEALGLPYLTLDRQARTLSGGETQRVNLASALGSGLISTQFILDEPSVGLHARDTEKLITAVKRLHERGNSVIVVEHDPEFIRAAQEVIEMGPASGEEGGKITFQGPQYEWDDLPLRVLPDESAQRVPSFSQTLQIGHASLRNLKDISVEIPLGHVVCLTGVSGSGKSTLVNEIIAHGYELLKSGRTTPWSLSGLDQINQVLLVDQSPLARSPRANIATYSKIWDIIRELLAQTDEAKSRALSKSSFSFNVNAGRCPACEGAGFVREDMQFLSDVYIPCEVCLGKRFQEKVLEVTYKGKNVHDFLRLSVDACATFFHGHSQIRKTIETLQILGLGHLTLGHPLSELSGGEAQRLKLVPFIEESEKGSSLLIFDEPTTGLHVRDVANLLSLFRTLRDKGHSLLVVEHNLTLISGADWIIDLGPEGGAEGGRVIKIGTPQQFAEDRDTYTAQYLGDHLDQLKTTRMVRKKKRAQKVAAQSKERMLSIIGAREHNLKDISLDIPLGKLVAFTGVSGSGKSSIAKDIIFAEGQRRYLDCLSPYARQFVKGLKRPEVDEVTNVLPALCVEQHTFQPSALSTVGTVSEVYNFLRLLYCKTGTQYCPDHPHEAISPTSPEQIVEILRGLKGGSVRILAPIIKQRKGNHTAVIARALQASLDEVRVDGVLAKPSQFVEGLAKSKVHSIEFVIAKCHPQRVDKESLQDAIAQALSLGGGEIIILSDGGEQIFSTERTCSICQRGFFKPDPEDLSFHSRRGRCEKCGGTGVNRQGNPCPECEGSRLQEIGRNIRLGGKNIYEASTLTPPHLRTFLQKIPLPNRSKKISEPVLREIYSKLEALEKVGLEYLALARDCGTLSGGELQRLRLATSMGSPMTGVLYIFDEPSVGLHPTDNERLLLMLRELQHRGNSVFMIEHDAQSILSADHIIEIGPGGGTQGGQLVFNGPKEEFLYQETKTAVALQEEAHYRSFSKRKPLGELTVEKASLNNLKDISCTLPLGNLVSFAGVSGAGKSSLLHGVIVETLANGKKSKNKRVSSAGTLQSSLEIEKVVVVDQKPIGATSRSTPASYLKIWDEIRKLFATTIEAKARGWNNAYFSYNTGGGRCPECGGQGNLKLEMNFLADDEVPCDLCGGGRYSDDANSITYQGLSITETLQLTFEEARERFTHHRKIFGALRLACELGLGYLTLGQSSSSLSGGESQRIKLVSELSSRQRGHVLYVLDEPTTGLHKSDVAKLLDALRQLVERGNSVFVIEHDPDMLAASDYIVELGPGPAEKGGRIIFTGHPEKLLKGKTPWAKVFQNIQGHSVSERYLQKIAL